MNKRILRKILIILFIINLIFVYFIKDINPIFAEGANGEGDVLDPKPDEHEPDEPEPDEPEPEPDEPDPNPDPDPQPPPPTTYSISGSVWEDTDISGMGIFNNGDLLLSGINVTLYSQNSSGSYSNTTTDHNGNYKFSDLSSGSYKIEFTYDDDTYNGLYYKSSFSPNDNSGTNAVDSQDRRLELMTKLYDINYETLSNLEGIDKKMIASSEVEITDSDVECNFPLIKRPKYSVKVTKNVSHLTVLLSDGSTLIDWDRASNPNPKYIMYLENNSLTAIMDNEITHGATIKIKYDITVENTSESDSLYKYLKPEYIREHSSIFSWLLNGFAFNFLDSVPTKYYLYDYLGNNLIFDENNNPDNWVFVNNDNLLPHNDNMDLSTLPVLVNEVTLKPGEVKTLTLNASKIMAIADTDLLTYDNYVEVIAYKSILGKILTYDDELNKRKILTPGNLNIYDDNREYEPDEAKAETVTRVPPFGKDLSYYTTIVGIIILAIEIAVLSTLKIKIKHLRSRYIRR